MNKLIQSARKVNNRVLFQNAKKFFANCVVDNPYTLKVNKNLKMK